LTKVECSGGVSRQSIIWSLKNQVNNSEKKYKKITFHDNEYLINNYKMNPYHIKYLDPVYK
jgi:hypothetical protein